MQQPTARSHLLSVFEQQPDIVDLAVAGSSL